MILPMKSVRRESGQSMIIFALAFVVLCVLVACVIDFGRVAVEKRQLQNAADAAALAGAQDLPNAGNAVSTAVDYAAQNGVDSSGTSVSVNSESTNITVQCTGEVDYTFAKVIGLSKTRVVAAATAKASASAGVTGLRPWALWVDKRTYNDGDSFDLKEGGGGGTTGDYGIISFGTQGTGANTYKSNVLDGYSGIVRVGDTVNEVSGNKNVKKDIDDLIAGTVDDYTKAKEGDPRVALVPKVDSDYKVVGFAVIYLHSVDNKGEISATFLYDTTWTEAQKENRYSWGLNLSLVK